MKFLRAMKKLKIKQQIIAAVMACVLGIGGIYSVHASVINDAKNKKNEAQQELDNLNSQIDEIQAAQSAHRYGSSGKRYGCKAGRELPGEC